MELTTLKAALKLGDENDIHDDHIQQWICEVRDTLWDVEDILDEYSLHEDLTDDVAHTPCCCPCTPQLAFFRYKMGRRIREIKERTKSIMDRAQQLKLIHDVAPSEAGTSASAVQRGGKWKKSSIMEDGSVPVAIDDKAQHIIDLLHLDDPKLQIVVVDGMGGKGKTFLLQHVFGKVQHLFQVSVWLSVSQTYSIQKLQRDLAYRLKLDIPADISCTMAAEEINAHLRQQKCLIVLDDVWRASEEDDLLKQLGIPIAADNGSKVMVTSRNKEVFRHLHPLMYHMPLLSAEDSWKLFCAHAFPSSYENSQARLEKFEKLAREIVEECGKLPLAIKTVASSLLEATTSGEWESKLHRLEEVGAVNHNDSILDILKLSYYWLPSFLKPCFLYLSFFPEDEEIDCEYMVNLWIAEGFIPQSKDEVDVAWDYLRHLANLCLVDVWESRVEDLHIYGSVHDLVLELAVLISKENKSAYSAVEASRKGNNSGCRRILLAKKGIDDKAIAETNLCCAQVVRTLSLSRNSIDSIPPHMLSNARVLRVLDLSHTRISTLPDSIGDLKLLRLLNLRDTQLKEVPHCVRKLKSLTLLDVSYCNLLSCLPLWIGELVSLQYLNIYGSSSGIVHIPKGVSKPMSLRILRSSHPLDLSNEDDAFLRLEDVGNISCLQEIRIAITNEVEMRCLAQGVLDRLVKMHTLELQSNRGGLAQIPLPETILAMKDLQTLQLFGFAVPGWVSRFENLRALYLHDCDCSELYPALQTMGKLTLLRLQNDKNCREFPKAFGKRGGFPNLRFFSIWGFTALEELPEMEDGAMPSLERLEVWNCRRLRNVPPGFHWLKRLRELRFHGSGTDELRSRLKEEWNTAQANHPQLCLV